MLKVDVQIKDNTDKLIAELQRNQLSFVAQGGQAIRAQAVVKAPVAQSGGGNLKSSIVTEAYVDDGLAVSETGPTAFYAPYIEYGTGIYAKNGQGRKTSWSFQMPDGRWVTTQGNRPQEFMEPGYQAAKGTIDRLAKALLA
jgi:HK97 gp10 family phage protein